MVQRSIALTEKKPYKYWNSFQNWYVDPPDQDLVAVDRVTSDIIESHNNYWNYRGSNGPCKSGDFHVIKRLFQNSSSHGTEPRHYGHYYNDGGLHSPIGFAEGKHFYGVLKIRQNLSHVDMPSPRYSSKPTMAALGSTAIARCLPTNPVGSLSQTLAELLSEGMVTPTQLDSMRGKTAAARNAGSSYLNYSFGWSPLVQDVKKLLGAVVNANSIIEEYVANSGKLIKTSYHFPDHDEVLIYDKNNFYLQGDSLLGILDQPFGVCKSSEKYHRKQWFEGAFTYYLPSNIGGSKSAYYSALANKVLGSRITPETLWNLAPWSWAADWASNLGDVVHNVVAFQKDGLTLVRGFMMETYEIDWNETLVGIVTRSHGPITLHQRRNVTSKQRVRVNPYSLGVFWDGLSGRQKATAVALGLARTSNHP